MALSFTLAQEVQQLLSGNAIYSDFYTRWQYLYESYIGGETYREGNHLTRYQLESNRDYQNRLEVTPLDNHCQSVVQVYNSFLFREEPERQFGSLENVKEVEDFLLDADMDGRSLNAFMKDVATWSSVFGHCWVLLAKPNLNAQTRADETNLQVRPYANLITPLMMLDWSHSRSPNGRYTLDYIRYLEDVNGDIRTVKEWTPEEIRTIVVDEEADEVKDIMVETNNLKMIPAICVYSKKSTIRGMGVSDIADIADTQKMIYNLNSELEESIRLDGHPSLVKTPNTEAGAGAGAIIHMPEDLDPALKPYILQHSGANIESILKTKESLIESIDKMANTGAVRATESRTMSGVAMDTEFQLLNARLSEKADNLELAEEQLWTIFAEYQGYTWDGEVDYPNSFGIRDVANDIRLLIESRKAVTDPKIIAMLEHEIAEQHFSEEEMAEYDNQSDFVAHEMVNPTTGDQVLVTTELEHEDLARQGWQNV